MGLENYEPSVIRSDKSVVVTGTPKETKAKFFELVKNGVRIVDGKEFKSIFPDKYIAAFPSVTVFTEGNRQKRTDGLEVYINKDDFIVNGEDYTDLMPIVLQHEVAELWYFSKTGFSMSPPPKAIGKEGRQAFAHALALREEYRYAFELGKAERFLEFITRHHEHVAPSETSLKEHQNTYNLVKQRIQKLDHDKRMPVGSGEE